MEDKRLGIPTNELISVGKGAVIAGIGAGLTYLTSAITQINFGEYTPIVVAVFGVVVNYVRKLIQTD